MLNVKLKKEIERKAEIFFLFSEPNRLRIFQFLIERKRAKVSDIAKKTHMSIACTSHHLQLMRYAQIVDAKREGVSIFYSITNDSFIKKLQSLIIN